MSCSTAGGGTGVAVNAIPSVNDSNSCEASQGCIPGNYGDGIIHSLRAPRRISKPAQRPSSLSGPSRNISTDKAIFISGQGFPPSSTDTRPTILGNAIQETATPSSSTSSYASSASNNTSTPARDASQAERNKQLAPLAAFKMEASPAGSSASSSMSSSSNLSTKEVYRQKRAKFEMGRARTWSNSPRITSGLPNELYLRSQRLVKHDRGGFQVAENMSDRALLVGYREGSRWKNKIDVLKLCQGDEWYGTYAQPFLTARSGNENIGIKVQCGNSTNSASHMNTIAMRVVNDKTAWRFTTGVSDARNINTGVQEEFEWHTHRNFCIQGQGGTRSGSVLVRKSNGHAVAQLEYGLWKPDSVMTGDLKISFLGSSQKYGGLWKIVVFAIGCCAQ
ncbi:hypothetical protein VM1G_11926 [Cytospora mali]|uniref:Uncharacterized protein n=1 Tax=Cytospora mali TaxID=578113 RepID=A0A194WC96_CYTMA|nr:hypothetical protein VM1G_11926 [Valsa mali]